MNDLETTSILIENGNNSRHQLTTTMNALEDLSSTIHPLSITTLPMLSTITSMTPTTYCSSQIVNHNNDDLEKEKSKPNVDGYSDHGYCATQTPVVDSDHDNQNHNIDRNKKLSISSVSDSGNESVDVDEDSCDVITSEKIINAFFKQQDNSKTMKMTRRRLSGNYQQAFKCNDEQYISDDDDEADDDNEGESTLSESSYPSSPVEYDGQTPLTDETIFDFETVCAAIDEKLIKPEANKSLPETAEKESSNELLNDNDEQTNKLQKQESNQAHFDNSCNDIIEEFREDRRNSVLIRSTSLKSGKTPPGTPGGKKIVRFADAMGLDLASIRHIVYDQPYMPPLAAFKSLELDDEDRDWLIQNRQPNSSKNPNTNNKDNKNQMNKMIEATLRMLFGQPSSDPLNFMERVRSNKVCLENCILSGPTAANGNKFTLTCIVRVLNICFDKKVLLRYTTNEWLTWKEVSGKYVPNSNDGFSDKFTIVLELAVNSNGHQFMMPGQRLLFAIRYLTDGQEEHWDNNIGMNYALIYQRC